MSIILKADNRNLTKGSKYSFLTDNYSSGVSSIGVDNGTNYAQGDHILIGNFGQESTEVATISSVSENILNFSTDTGFSHSESTKVTVIPYNQAIFYYTTTATYDVGIKVAGPIDIQPDSYFTIASDSDHTTGFGWYVFYNSTTNPTKVSKNSNAIPYAGFAENSVKKILDSFFSQLNQKDLKLISNVDAFRWLNEGYNKAKNSLNLVNQNYTVSDEYEISVTSGTQEYDLSSLNFSGVRSLFNDGDGKEITLIDLGDVENWGKNSSNDTKYYLRGSFLGFSPTPGSDFTAILRYKQTISTLTSYYDTIVLPNNQYFVLLDFMMYKASLKLKNGQEGDYLKTFDNSVQGMKVTSHKQDNQKDSWGIAPTANV